MIESRFSRTIPATARARRLRREATFPERLVWSRLRSGALGGYSFRRQHPAGPYTLDFFCAELRVAVEIDGDSHGHHAQRMRDARRDAWLADHGVQMLRFWNDEVLTNLDGVVETIWRAIEDAQSGQTRNGRRWTYRPKRTRKSPSLARVAPDRLAQKSPSLEKGGSKPASAGFGEGSTQPVRSYSGSPTPTRRATPADLPLSGGGVSQPAQRKPS
jgi:very-short-patch-repair endonuclease